MTMTDRSALLNVILQPGGLRPLFQPIVDVSLVTPAVVSVECLVRGPIGTNLEPANVLFDYVRFKREESAVDRACILAVLTAARELDPSTRLGVNVHACTLGRDQGFVSFLQSTARDSGIEMSRLTVEVVEHAPPWDGVSFLAALDRLRSLGVMIALDDVGLGQSNFKMILDVRPDLLKIDRYFVKGMANDPNRLAVIESIALLASRFDARLIAEGVDDLDDLDAAIRLGITLLQGFYFYQPMSSGEFASRAPMPPLRLRPIRSVGGGVVA